MTRPIGVEDPGGEGLFGLETPPRDAGVVIVPVPFEATVSYGRGTADGPAAILDASGQLDLFDLAHQMHLCDELEDAGLLSPTLKANWVVPMKRKLIAMLERKLPD